MCFRFGSCFGSGSGQDYGRSTPKTTHRGGGGGRWSQGDYGYYSGVDQKAPPAYQQQPAADEPGRKDDHNGGVRRGPVDGAGGHGGHPAYAQDKADDDTFKHPAAWNGKVGDHAGHTYTERLNDAADYHREHTAVDHHHHPATATTNLAR
jgi:hypothetical protein